VTAVVDDGCVSWLSLGRRRGDETLLQYCVKLGLVGMFTSQNRVHRGSHVPHAKSSLPGNRPQICAALQGLKARPLFLKCSIADFGGLISDVIQ
jgi:hypothetical protein